MCEFCDVELRVIAPGTLCWIIKTEPRNEHMLRRVITVVSIAIPQPLRGNVPMHEIDAPWLRAEHPRTKFFAPPSSLRPIAGPGNDLVRVRHDEPVNA